MSKTLRFTKVLLAIFALCLSAAAGGQNSVFAQGTEVTDVLKSASFKLEKYGNYSTTSENGVTYCLFQAMNGNGDVIQVNGKYKSYFAVTNAPAGYTVKSVTVNFQKSSKTTFSVYGQQQAYPEADATHKGDELKKGISLNDKSYEFTASYPYFALYTVGSNAVYINDITVVWTTAGGSVETVAAPTINPASQKFSEAFDATITGAEGTTLKYTLDGTDPTTSETAKAVQAATATVNIPAATTTLKAIALKGDLVSRVAEAVYTYRAPSDNDGSFAKPYTAEEFADLKPQNVWVKGTVLGEIKNGSIGDFADFFNVTIGTEQGVHIALKLDKDSNFRNIDWQNKIGAELMAFGSYTKDYNGTKGMANEPEYLYIADPANALALIDVKTTEGYATYFNDQLSVTIPEGVKAQCGVITGANAGQLTIDYRYAAGTEIPSGNAVLVKAEGAVKIPLMVSKHNTSVVAENLLKGQAATGMIPEDASKKFYKLAYNNFDTKTGLGFYWGAVNGAAFEVPAGLAYLELPKEVAAKCFLLDGTTTGVEGVEVEQNAPAKTVYTLDGRKVDAHNLTKGIYIVNGKKVIVK